MINLMPSMHAMRWALAILAVVVAGLLGQHLGAQSERDIVAKELAAHESNLAAVEQRYQTEVAQLRTQRDIADASNLDLQKSLQQLQTQTLDEKSSQRLYSKIEGTDISSGLSVDTVTRVNDDSGRPTELHITVVQARGRNRVKGQIGVALVGQKGDSNWREVLVEAGNSAAPRFDMRFFQTVVVPVPENDFRIDIVDIRVKPDGKRHKSFSHEMDWSSILED